MITNGACFVVGVVTGFLVHVAADALYRWRRNIARQARLEKEWHDEKKYL